MKLIERFMAQKRTELNAMFDEMPMVDQKTWISKFEEEVFVRWRRTTQSIPRQGYCQPDRAAGLS
ncbi:hypothetical protein ACFS07_36760 [Undibacterium arcticum]